MAANFTGHIEALQGYIDALSARISNPTPADRATYTQLTETLRALRAEEAARAAQRDVLERERRHFRQAFRESPVAAAIVSLSDERLLEVNRAFERVTGYSAAEALGRTSKELGLWASASDQAAIQYAANERGVYGGIELHVRTKEKTIRDILSSTEIITLDGKDGRLHVFHDITERKQREQKLIRVVDTVTRDAAQFSHSIVERLSQLRSDEAQVDVELTRRERQVLERVARGLGNEVIAEELGIAGQTVRNYITRIYEKLGVHTRAEAVVWARERGLAG